MPSVVRQLAVSAATLAVLGGCAGAAFAQQAPPVPSVRVPAPVPPPWRFGIEVGFTDVSGNRDLTVFAGTFTAEHQRRDLFIFNTKLEARYGQSNGSRAVDNSAFRLRFDWRPRDRVSPFLGADVERDAIRRIRTRVSGGTGFNFNLVSRDDRRALVALGLIGEVEYRDPGISPNEVGEVRLHTRASYFNAISRDISVEANAKYQPAVRYLPDYLSAADAVVRARLSRALAFSTRFEWKRDSRPAPGVLSRDDRTLTASLLIAF